MLQAIHRLRTLRRFLMLAVLCTGLSAAACLNDINVGDSEDGLALAYNGQEASSHGSWARGIVLSSVGVVSLVTLVGVAVQHVRRG